jgi:tripartite-type tricarboxylate transporter receptor subunit TctC
MTSNAPIISPTPFLKRRQLLVAGLASTTCAFAMQGASAQAAYPTRPVRLIVPFGPGGFADITTRIVGERLAARLGQQVVIENRPGAGGIVAANAVLGSANDGHSMILFSNGTTIATTLLKLPYNPETDFLPVSSLAYFDLLLLTSASSRFDSLGALLAEGRRRPVTFGSINPGSTQHLSAELFKSVSGVQATVIPFKTSGEVQLALQRGDVDLGFESYAALKGAVDGGLLRALACTGSSRTGWLPNVPTVKEEGVAGYDVTGWNAFYMPAGTPQIAITTLNAAMQSAIAEPGLRERFRAMGADPRGNTPTEMAAVFARDKLKWAKVISDAKITVS